MGYSLEPQGVMGQECSCSEGFLLHMSAVQLIRRIPVMFIVEEQKAQRALSSPAPIYKTCARKKTQSPPPSWPLSKVNPSSTVHTTLNSDTFRPDHTAQVEVRPSLLLVYRRAYGWVCSPDSIAPPIRSRLRLLFIALRSLASPSPRNSRRMFPSVLMKTEEG